jgi:hypothetical protein
VFGIADALQICMFLGADGGTDWHSVLRWLGTVPERARSPTAKLVNITTHEVSPGACRHPQRLARHQKLTLSPYTKSVYVR